MNKIPRLRVPLSVRGIWGWLYVVKLVPIKHGSAAKKKKDIAWVISVDITIFITLSWASQSSLSCFLRKALQKFHFARPYQNYIAADIVLTHCHNHNDLERRLQIKNVSTLSSSLFLMMREWAYNEPTYYYVSFSFLIMMMTFSCKIRTFFCSILWRRVQKIVGA